VLRALPHGRRSTRPCASNAIEPTEGTAIVTAAPILRRGLDAALEATVVLSFSRVGYEVRRRADDWASLDELDGSGRRVVVTGANSGLGLAAARALASAGAEVVAVVRSEDKGRRTLDALEPLGHAGARHSYELADLADLGQVRSLADRLTASGSIDAVIHNAGAMFDHRALTTDGLERTYQVHVVAPFLLTTLLLDSLEAAPAPRVVTVTSGGMYAERLDADRVDSPDTYRPALAYARAKRAQVALNDQWARRVGHRGIDFQVVHPGWADTPGVVTSLPGFHRLTSPILRDADQGADTMVWLALGGHVPRQPTGDAQDSGGRLWHDRRPRGAHHLPWTRTPPSEAERLWDRVARDAGVDPTA
jgi:dehydrogenase/reductase SDR family member 12